MQEQTKASESQGDSRWSKAKANFLPLAICLALLAFSILQATYFRADLRKIMLESGRRAQYSISPHKKDWLFDAKHLFDGDLQSFARIPFMEGDPSLKAELSIELALTHFPSPTDNALPIIRKPVLLEIYNGACSQCPLSVFQKHGRIREARLEILRRKLILPIVDYLLPEEVSIWQKKVHFPDRPGPQKVDLSSLRFYDGDQEQPREIGIVVLKIHVTSVYPAHSEGAKSQYISLAEIRYADQSLLKKDKLHYWD